MRSEAAVLPEFADCVGIFQGGGCRAAAYAGAYAAALDRGVNFDEVAGASAGSIAAVLIAAGASKDQLHEMLTSLDFKTFLRKPKGTWGASSAGTLLGKLNNLARFNGLYDGSEIETWVERQLRSLLPDLDHPKVRFSDLRRPASVIATNLETHGPVVWSTRATPKDSVAEAVRSSCSIPFFFQPHGPFVDGGVLSNLPLHIIENDPADLRRVLAFALTDSEGSERPRDIRSTAAALFSTVTEGGKAVQQALRANVDVISIRCGDVKATDFESMTPERVEGLVAAGAKAVNDFFGAGTNLAVPVKPLQVSNHLAQTLAAAVENLLAAQHSVTISLPTGTDRPNWYFDLYTSLLLARLKNVDIRVLVESANGAPDAVQEQVATLKALGCAVAQLPKGEALPVHAIICDPRTSSATAITLSGDGLEIHARMLSALDGDSTVINLIGGAIEEHCVAPGPGPTIDLKPADATAVEDALLKVRQYATGPSFSLERVRLEDIDSWARYAHVYKQRQQSAMLRALRERGFEEFDPFIVDYGQGQGSLALPIVVERTPNGRCTVVNGLSRLLLLKREGADAALCAVMAGVNAQPPALGVEPLSYLGVKVGSRDRSSHRYPGFVYQNVRSVEREAHLLRSMPQPNADPEGSE